MEFNICYIKIEVAFFSSKVAYICSSTKANTAFSHISLSNVPLQFRLYDNCLDRPCKFYNARFEREWVN